MKSIGTRLAAGYAIASLLTLWLFFRVGRSLVEQHIIHAIDVNNAAAFEEITQRLGPEPASLPSETIRMRLRGTPEFWPAKLGVEIIAANGQPLFRSDNLLGRTIPTTPAPSGTVSHTITRVFRYLNLEPETTTSGRNFNAVLSDFGEMRVGIFALGSATVRICASKTHVRNAVLAYQQTFYGLLAFMIIVSAAIGFILSRIVLRPLRLIQATAARISSENLSERIPVSRVKDELSDLARLLNQTFDRLEAAFNQIRRFTAEASHELKTPLSLMRLHAENVATHGGLTAEQEESLHLLLDEIVRLNKIIEELLFLSRAQARAITLNLQPSDPQACVRQFVADARVLVESRGLRLVENSAGSGFAQFDAKWIRQVLFNLVTNAMRMSPPDGSIKLTSELHDRVWRVAVEDEGPGVAKEFREQIFGQFVRLESGGRQNETGSGLGLAISRSIVQLHQGKIYAESPQGRQGLRVVFEIPSRITSG
jgi:signal transduction histidine kinase